MTEPWLIYCQNTNKYGFMEVFHEDLQGRKQGLCIGKHHNKTTAYEFVYKDGEKHGTCITYNNNGTPRRIENYKEGVLDGLYEEFYSDGSPKMSLTYINGAQFGEAQHWKEKSN